MNPLREDKPLNIRSLSILVFLLLISLVIPVNSSFAQTTDGFPESIIVSSSTDTTPHLLKLKATQQDGTEFLVSGFSLDATNAVGAQANSQLLVLVTDSALRIMEAKVRTASDQVIDLVPVTPQQTTGTFSLTNLAAGVYTLDVIAQKGNTRAAYEGILVIGQQPTNLQTIIKQQTTDENGNGGNGSNGKLDVSIAVGRDPIVRGNIQTISTTVTDSQSEDGISGAKIDGQVRYVTGHVERFTGNSNGDGKYEHQWRISGNANTGVFQVEVDASASGHGTASGSASFRVIGASQTGLLSQPDPCLDNSTLTDCQPNPCDLPNPPAECGSDPCDGPNPPADCPEPIDPCDLPNPPADCPEPIDPCDLPNPPLECEDPIIIDDPPVIEDEEEEEDEADEEAVEEESDDESSSEDEDSNFG